MTGFSERWWASVQAATSVGQQLVGSADEFDAACEHMLTDASKLLEAGSHASAAFLAITAIEETAKVHIGSFRRSTESVPRRKDPLYSHAEKHKLALGPTVSMGGRLLAAIGEERMQKVVAEVHAGEFVKLREAALYVAQAAGGLVAPSTTVSPQTAREVLLLAIEAFDDGLVGFTSRSVELSQATNILFSKWAQPAERR